MPKRSIRWRPCGFLDSDPGFLSRYRARGASEPYQVRAAFGFGWDALDRKTGQPYAADPEKYPRTDHFHRIAQRLSTPERQVIVSNEQDFFEDFEATHGASLDRVAVTYGNEWDLYSASMVGDLRAGEARGGKAAVRRDAGGAGEPEIPVVHDEPSVGARPGVHRARSLLGTQLDGRWSHPAYPARGLARAIGQGDRVLRGRDP